MVIHHFIQLEPLIKAHIKIKKIKTPSLGSWHGLKIIAIGPRGGKIVGYDSHGKPIYAGSEQAEVLASMAAAAQTTEPDVSEEIAQVVKWLKHLGIDGTMHGLNWVQVSEASAKMLATSFGVESEYGGHGLHKIFLGQLYQHVGQALKPAEDEHIVWAAKIAAGADADPGFPDLNTLKELPAGEFAGTHGNTLFQDSTGKRWVFKSANPTIARAEEAATRIGRLILGDRIPRAQFVTVNGKDGVLIEVFDGSVLGKDHSNPSSYELLANSADVMKHEILDWLISNHDSHAGNFLYQENQLVAIDKGQAWKWIGKDKLDPSYHGDNPSPVIYKKFWSDEIQKNIDPKYLIAAAADALDAAEKITPEQFHSIILPYVATYGGWKEDLDTDALVEVMTARLTNLRADFEKFLSKQFGYEVTIPKKTPSADNFETMPEPKPGTPKLVVTEPAKPAVIQGETSQPIPAGPPVPGWPITKGSGKGKTTVHSPGNPPPLGWKTGVPGPGFTASVVYKKKAYQLEISQSAEGKPAWKITFPDGTEKITHSANIAGDWLYLYDQSLSLDMSAAEKKEKKISLGGKVFKIDQFVEDLAASYGQPVVDAQKTVGQLEQEKVVEPEQKILTKDQQLTRYPDGLIFDQTLLPSIVADWLWQHPAQDIDDSWKAKVPPGYVIKMVAKDGSGLMLASPVLTAAGKIKYQVWEQKPDLPGGWAEIGLVTSAVVENVEAPIFDLPQVQALFAKHKKAGPVPLPGEAPIAAAIPEKNPEIVVPLAAPKSFAGPLAPGTSITSKAKNVKGDIVKLMLSVSENPESEYPYSLYIYDHLIGTAKTITHAAGMALEELGLEGKPSGWKLFGINAEMPPETEAALPGASATPTPAAPIEPTAPPTPGAPAEPGAANWETMPEATSEATPESTSEVAGAPSPGLINWEDLNQVPKSYNPQDVHASDLEWANFGSSIMILKDNKTYLYTNILSGWIADNPDPGGKVKFSSDEIADIVAVSQSFSVFKVSVPPYDPNFWNNLYQTKSSELVPVDKDSMGPTLLGLAPVKSNFIVINKFGTTALYRKVEGHKWQLMSEGDKDLSGFNFLLSNQEFNEVLQESALYGKVSSGPPISNASPKNVKYKAIFSDNDLPDPVKFTFKMMTKTLEAYKNENAKKHEKPPTYPAWVPPPGVFLEATYNGKKYFLASHSLGYLPNEQGVLEPNSGINFGIIDEAGNTSQAANSPQDLQDHAPIDLLFKVAKEAGIDVPDSKKLLDLWGLTDAVFAPGETYETVKNGQSLSALPGPSNKTAAEMAPAEKVGLVKSKVTLLKALEEHPLIKIAKAAGASCKVKPAKSSVGAVFYVAIDGIPGSEGASILEKLAAEFGFTDKIKTYDKKPKINGKGAFIAVDLEVLNQVVTIMQPASEAASTPKSPDNFETMHETHAPVDKKIPKKAIKKSKKQSAEEKAKIEKAKALATWAKEFAPVTDAHDQLILGYFGKALQAGVAQIYARKKGGKLILTHKGDPEGFQKFVDDLKVAVDWVETPLGKMASIDPQVLADALPGKPAGMITGPDGKSYPAGTTFETQTEIKTVQTALSADPNFYKIKEHKTAPELMVLKIPGNGEEQQTKMKGLVQKFGLKGPYSDPKVSENSVVFFATKESLDAVYEKTEKTIAHKPEVPQFVAAGLPLSTDLAIGDDASESGPHELSMLTTGKFGRYGRSILMGGDGVFREFQVNVRKVKAEDGKFYFEVQGQLANFRSEACKLTYSSYVPIPSCSTQVDKITGLKIQAHSVEEGYTIENGSAGSILEPQGFTGNTEGGSRIRVYDGDVTFKGVFTVRIPESADIESELATAFSAIGVDASQAMAPANLELYKKVATVRAMMGANAWNKQIQNPESVLDEQWLDEHLAYYKAKNLAKNASIRKTAEGNLSVVLNDGEKFKKAGWKFAYRNDKDWRSVYLQITSGIGWAARKARYLSGSDSGGMSPTQDVKSGGATGIFTRLAPESQSFYGGQPAIIFHPRVFERTDWYRYNSDSYGSLIDCGYGSPSSGKQRYDSIKDLSSSNEIIFAGGIALEDVLGVVIGDSEARQALINALHTAGIDQVNGVPVEDFVLTGASSTENLLAKVHKDLKP